MGNKATNRLLKKAFLGRLSKVKIAEKRTEPARRFSVVNEHLERLAFQAILDAAEATQIVFQQPANRPVVVEHPCSTQ